LWIVLDRPESKNGLTAESNAALIEAFGRATREAEVRAVVLTGAGGSFSSGLDLKAAMRDAMGVDVEARLRQLFHGLIRAVRACPKPVVALVDGPAAGFGCDLALACDIRIGTDRARFGEVFVRRGIMPDGGGTWLLPRIVGLGKALELMMTGDLVEADEALSLGLVTRLVPHAQAEAECAKFAARLAAGAPMVHARVKAAVYASLASDLDAALERECKGQLELLRSRDFMEGVAAFIEKREPRFRGE
jgi:enoyl-CoA hydratase/carnithine racemase